MKNLIELVSLFGFLCWLVFILKRSSNRFYALLILIVVIFFWMVSDSYSLVIFFFISGIVAFTFLIIKMTLHFKKLKQKPEKIERNSDEHIYFESNIGTITIENIWRGTIIMGGAGSGKSKSLFYPIIQQLMNNNFTGLLYDFKSPELSELAHFYHKEDSNVKFAILDFKDYKNSTRVNPIHPKYLEKQAIAFEMATVLVNNLLPESIKKKDYWTRSSIAILAGTMWYLKKNYPELCSIPHMIAMLLDFPSGLLIEKLSSDSQTAGMISSLKEAHEMKAEKQIAGVVGTLKMAIAQLNIPEVFYLLSKNEINLNLNDIDNPSFLCIGNDSSLSDTFSPVISLIISVCSRQMNEKGKLKSAILLDEAPTLYIPNFEQIPATARSNKVATFFGLQDYSQMVDKYGSDKAQVMISNLGNQFFGRTVNSQTAKMIINLFGRHDVKYKNTSNSSSQSDSGSSQSSSTGESWQQRDRVKVSDITNMKAGTFYGVLAESNHNEILDVQFNEVESNYKAFKSNNFIDCNEVFEKIYKDVQLIRNNKIDGIETKSKNINFNFN